MLLNNKNWWKAAAVRAAKTFAQACVGLIPAAATISAVDWLTVVYTAALAAVLSIFSSFAGLPEVDGKIYGWWKASGYRALKTVFQTALGMIPAAATIADVHWITVASASLLAGAVSLLMSVGSITVPEYADVDNGKIATVPAYEHWDENGDPISDEKWAEMHGK